ncbi:MAG: RluA family pseudouridine synthase [Gillisia sp.]
MRILEKHIVPEITEKIRLQEYAAGIFTSIPTKSGIKKAIKRKEILVNGKVGSTGDWVLAHQEILLLASEKPDKKVFKLKLEVIYEDDFLAVVQKPPGIPTSGNYFRTIENALPFNLKRSAETDALPFPLPAHRLDAPTSGLLIIAKTRKLLTQLNLAFETREIQKAYTALVHGLTPEKLQISTRIDGKDSFTSVETLQQYRRGNQDFSLLKVKPSTGRTHQIRIHLSSEGFPIAGDALYGPKSDCKKLALAATGLEFIHSATGEQLQFEIVPPDWCLPPAP